MTAGNVLYGIFVYLAAAVIAAPLATRLGLGSVLGYLMAGVLIGPAAFDLLGGGSETVMRVSEFGVIVMLFLVGLELQPAKLWALRRSILGLGSLQVAGVAATLAAAAIAIGLPWKEALTAGLVLAMSSTAIVVQSLTERGLLKSTAGEASFAVLLFQDIAVIPILALLPLLATTAAGTPHDGSLIAHLPAWQQTLAVLAAVALIVLAGRYLMRPLFRFVAQSGIRETFVGLALLIVISITLLMEFVGLSAALGTFLGGVVLAESEYRHELEQDLAPFKGLLLAAFFIAVGSGIDFGLFLAAPLQLAGLVAGFVILKLALQLAAARLFRLGRADSWRFAFALAQGGEFAFVLIAFAAGLGLLTAHHAALLVAMVALSMALAPLLMLVDERLVQPRFAAGNDSRPADAIAPEGARVIIAGHGRFGMTVGRLLLASGCRPVVLDHDAEQIDVLRRFGFKVHYGDASRLDLLEAAGAREAALIVIAIDDAEKVLEIADTVRRHFPSLRILARAYDRTHAYRLVNAGVDEVFREVFGSSMDLGERALVAIGKHPYEAHRAARAFRAHDEELLRRAAPHMNDSARLVDISRAARAEISNVLSGDRADGRSADRAWEDEDRPPPEDGDRPQP
jgi:monovalent cation:proton antiporter-2 (CPA2) family protein